MLKVFIKVGVLCAAFALSPAYCAQVVKTDDNLMVTANISNAEPTRISVDGDRIAYVRGLDEAYMYKNDDAQGVVFITPKETQKTPFYLFISTEQQHNFILRLNPTAHHADFLIVKLKSIQKAKAEDLEKAVPYQSLLTDLIKQMATGQESESYAVTTVKHGKTLYLPRKLKLRLQTLYEGEHLVGAVFVLTNGSPYDVTLSESDFYKLGDCAIALKTQVLRAGETTLLYKVIARG